MSIDPDYDREHETLHERNCRLQEEGAIAKLRSELAAANERVKELEETVTGLRGLDIQNESIIAASNPEFQGVSIVAGWGVLMEQRDTLNARIAALTALVAKKDEYLRVIASGGEQFPEDIASAALALRVADCAKEDKE